MDKEAVFQPRKHDNPLDAIRCCNHDHDHSHRHVHGDDLHHPHHDHSHENEHSCGCELSHEHEQAHPLIQSHNHTHTHEHMHREDGCGCAKACSITVASPLDAVSCCDGHGDHNHDASAHMAKQGALLQKLAHPNPLVQLGLAGVLFALGFVHPYFFLASYVVAGYRVIWTAFRRINMLDEFFLMTVASIGAIAIGEYPEAAAVMILFGIGEYFKDRAVGKSKQAISSLLTLRPTSVHLVDEVTGAVSIVDPESVAIGQVIDVKVGERVPLDGVLLSATGELNNAAISGESEPVLVSTGADLISGGVVIGSPIRMRVSKRFQDSTISRIIALVEEAKDKKTSTEQFISKFSRYYTPGVVLASILICLVPSFFYGFEHFTTWLHRGLIFLVVSCPCALVISVPLSYFAGIGKASNSGMLMKGSVFLDALTECNHIVFDKTGTLTTGEFEVHNVEHSSELFYPALAAVEANSIHPIAVAIHGYAIRHLGEKRPMEVGKISEIPGLGIRAESEAGTVLVGSAALMKDAGIAVPSVQSNKTLIFVAIADQYAGHLEVGDVLRSDTAEAIREMSQHMKVTILSGDKHEVTADIANQLGITSFFSPLLPEQKYEKVQSFLKNGDRVIFVGDGINDAPVLAGATIGISMGLSGTDAAIEASDAVLMKPGVASIPRIVEISRYTKRIVKENIALSLGVKVVVMALSALGFANMWMAVIADVGATLVAVLNTLRIARK